VVVVVWVLVVGVSASSRVCVLQIFWQLLWLQQQGLSAGVAVFWCLLLLVKVGDTALGKVLMLHTRFDASADSCCSRAPC
jgi:hypothetical protein